MKKRITSLSVGELARMSGVSVRTLHHYDQIGLLKPAQTGMNGYRIYGRAEALRLQEILFYRAVGMSLADISALLGRDENPLARLLHHRDVLAKGMQDNAARLATLDRTIADLNGDHDMNTEDLYAPFAAEKQAEYEDWLVKIYGGDMADKIAQAKQAVEDLPDGLAGAMDQLREIESGLVEMFDAGVTADDEQLHPLLERHRGLMAQLWGRDCAPAAFRGLGELYLAHPDFVARYEKLSRKFSQWLPAAMAAHAARLET